MDNNEGTISFLISEIQKVGLKFEEIKEDINDMKISISGINHFMSDGFNSYKETMNKELELFKIQITNIKENSCKDIERLKTDLNNINIAQDSIKKSNIDSIKELNKKIDGNNKFTYIVTGIGISIIAIIQIIQFFKNIL
jgi:hypothetical protein